MYVDAGGNDSFTKLLLHCDGPNGSTTFTDSSASAHSFSIANGSPSLSNALFKYGQSALDLGTVANSRITTPNSSDFDFGSSDFTIDVWGEPGASGGGNFMFNDNALANGFFVGFTTTNMFIQMFSASAVIGSYTANPGLSTGQLGHLAWARNGSTILLFANGVSLAVTIGTNLGASSIPASGQPLFIGSSFVPPRRADEIRISKGIARWTANFSPYGASYD